MIMSEWELGEIESEISAVLKEENEEVEFRTQVIGEFALNLIEDFRRSQSEAAELRERVGELEGALQKLREHSKPHGGESPGEAGLQDIVYEIAGATLSQTKESG